VGRVQDCAGLYVVFFCVASRGSCSPQMLAYLDHSQLAQHRECILAAMAHVAVAQAVGMVGVCEGCGFAVGADFFCCCCFFLLTPCNLRVTSAARVSGEDPADIAQVLHQTKRQ
jgi:hypothetical protein